MLKSNTPSKYLGGKSVQPSEQRYKNSIPISLMGSTEHL